MKKVSLLKKYNYIENNILEKIILGVLKINKKQLFFLDNFSKKEQIKIQRTISKYKSGIPLEYILEKAEFYGYEFFVNKNTLIPRNETEILVESIINFSKNYKKKLFIDIGTGSSNIICSLAKNIDSGEFIANDISKKTLKIAKKNIEKFSLNISLFQGDLFLAIINGIKDINFFKEKNIFISANLPYIKNKDFKNMDFSTKNFEPKLSLYGGKNTGFELYKRLIKQIKKFLKYTKIKNIFLFIEIGFDQYSLSKSFLEKQKLKYKYIKDNRGVYRIIMISFNIL